MELIWREPIWREPILSRLALQVYVSRTECLVVESYVCRDHRSVQQVLAYNTYLNRLLRFVEIDRDGSNAAAATTLRIDERGGGRRPVRAGWGSASRWASLRSRSRFVWRGATAEIAPRRERNNLLPILLLGISVAGRLPRRIRCGSGISENGLLQQIF